MSSRTSRTCRRLVAGLAATAGVLGMTLVATPLAGATPAATAKATISPALAPTPPMGFNDWNAFGCNVDEALIKQTADFFVSSGLKAAGYHYVDIDDCWLLKARNAQGHLVPDPVKFPDGIKGTAAYVHSLGLKLGIYEDAGTATCAGYPGSLGHEQTDADDFAAWGVDLLKYDNCNNNSDGSLAEYQARYRAMSRALASSGRKILLSLCEWGVNNPGAWASKYGSMWRTTGDINDSWGSLKSIIAQNIPLAQYARPGAWNDPDMLEIGNGGMTDTEYRTHFSMWAEMAAPLMIGTDLRTASAATMKILTNKAVIAVDQDRLGVQGQAIVSNADGSTVLSKPLANGDRAIALYNPTDQPMTLSTTAARAGLAKAKAYRVTDLWSHAATETAGTVAATVAAHGTVLVRVSPIKGATTLAPLTGLAVDAGQADPSLPAATSPGGDLALATTATDYGTEKLTGVRVTTDAPDGWTVTADDASARGTLATGRSLTTHWTLTAPSDAAPGAYPVTVSLRYGYGRNRSAVQEQRVTVQVATAPAAGADAVSDLSWTSSQNYWGPVEKDMSNGEKAAGDGRPITIGGTVYAKGLGTNAPAQIVYYLGGRCSSFTSKVGIDDEVGSGTTNGVIFRVAADGATRADSGVVGKGAAHTVTADVHGATWLTLTVDDNGDTNYDHADWAQPVLTCS